MTHQSVSCEFSQHELIPLDLTCPGTQITPTSLKLWTSPLSQSQWWLPAPEAAGILLCEPFITWSKAAFMSLSPSGCICTIPHRTLSPHLFCLFFSQHLSPSNIILGIFVFHQSPPGKCKIHAGEGLCSAPHWFPRTLLRTWSMEMCNKYFK